LVGLGRKICLKLISYYDEISSFDRGKSYVEEGQFNGDNFHHTFGRRIYMDESMEIGWFIKGEGESVLHGFGINNKNNGLFVHGKFN
jgi:hypothetical protein